MHQLVMDLATTMAVKPLLFLGIVPMVSSGQSSLLGNLDEARRLCRPSGRWVGAFTRLWRRIAR